MQRRSTLSRPKKIALIVVLIFTSLVLLSLLVVQTEISTQQSKIYSSTERIEARPVGIVFGAGVYTDGPGREVRARLDTALALYESGKVQTLLLTGGPDEVRIMRSYVEQHNVPTNLITDDVGGIRTYHSCYRAVHTFGVTEAILISQPEYLPRTLYLCNSLGLQAIGLSAGTVQYGLWDGFWNGSREYFAQLRAWFEVTL